MHGGDLQPLRGLAPRRSSRGAIPLNPDRLSSAPSIDYGHLGIRLPVRRKASQRRVVLFHVARDEVQMVLDGKVPRC